MPRDHHNEVVRVAESVIPDDGNPTKGFAVDRYPTERVFRQWGVRLLVVARFVPGLSLVAVPLCGAMGVRLRSFIWHDCAGLALWAATGLILGITFAAQIQDLLTALSAMGEQTLIVISAATTLYLAYRYARRVRTTNAS